MEVTFDSKLGSLSTTVKGIGTSTVILAVGCWLLAVGSERFVPVQVECGPDAQANIELI